MQKAAHAFAAGITPHDRVGAQIVFHVSHTAEIQVLPLARIYDEVGDRLFGMNGIDAVLKAFGMRIGDIAVQNAGIFDPLTLSGGRQPFTPGHDHPLV